MLNACDSCTQRINLKGARFEIYDRIFRRTTHNVRLPLNREVKPCYQWRKHFDSEHQMRHSLSAVHLSTVDMTREHDDVRLDLCVGARR